MGARCHGRCGEVKQWGLVCRKGFRTKIDTGTHTTNKYDNGKPTARIVHVRGSTIPAMAFQHGSVVALATNSSSRQQSSFPSLTALKLPCSSFFHCILRPADSLPLSEEGSSPWPFRKVKTRKREKWIASCSVVPSRGISANKNIKTIAGLVVSSRQLAICNR
jgi:hypothetical protein